jgi:hypothetical protein
MVDDTQAQLPTPDPALRCLDRFVGMWSMEGHLPGSDEIVIKGETTFRWLPGGFFLEQHGTMDLMGMQLDSPELIGYDPETATFHTPFTRTCPQPLLYRWEVEGDTLKISVSYGPLDATFIGSFGADSSSFGEVGATTPAPTRR